MKRAKYVIVLGLLAISITACSKKTTNEIVETSETQTVESTEDKFSLGDKSVTVIKETETLAPEETEVVEVYETYADGSYSGKWANGDTFVSMHKPGELGMNTAPEDKIVESSKSPEAETNTETNTEINTGVGNTDTTEPTQQNTQPTTEIPNEVQQEFKDLSKTKMTETEYVTYDVVVSFWIEHPERSEDYVRDMIDEGHFPSLSASEREALISEIFTKYPHDPAETVPYEY